MLLPMLMMAGIVLGLFLGILLFSLDRGNKPANRLLGIIMTVSSLCVSDFAISKLGVYQSVPHLIGIVSSILFLIGPSFYFYIRTLMGEFISLNIRELLHLLPFVLLIIYRLPFYLLPAQTKLDIFNNDISFQYEHRLIILFQAVHAVIYFIVMYKQAFEYSKRIKKSGSDTEIMILRWIRKCLNPLSFIFGFVVLVYLLKIAGIDLHHTHAVIIPLMISGTVLYLGFTGLKHPVIIPEAESVKRKKYETSTLTEEKAYEYMDNLLSLMNSEKPYFQSDLTLQKLAGMLSISPNHLSQIINEKTGQNFIDFINSYRIKTAQEMLSGEQGKLLTISAIGLESGFNSKSSFNSAFKKHTGFTPSEFKLKSEQFKA